MEIRISLHVCLEQRRRRDKKGEGGDVPAGMNIAPRVESDTGVSNKEKRRQYLLRFMRF